MYNETHWCPLHRAFTAGNVYDCGECQRLVWMANRPNDSRRELAEIIFHAFIGLILVFYICWAAFVF